MAVINGTKLSDGLIGTLADDQIFGLEGSDTLLGLGGSDILDGGEDADLMDGGEDGDLYIVDNIGDVVRDSGSSGVDEVRTSMSYSLANLESIETLRLLGDAATNGTGNFLNNTIYGNAGANSLSGRGGNDTLLGDAGDDTLDGGSRNTLMEIDSLVGGAGNDTYIVDDEMDVVNEELVGPAGGTDTVISTAQLFNLPQNVEDLILEAGVMPEFQVGGGNDLDNEIVGNGLPNFLGGGLGNDTLVGGDGDDELFGSGADGGFGADLLIGGSGDDRYEVDEGDRIQESIAGIAGGIDEVLYRGSAAFVLGTNLEEAVLTKCSLGTGNALDNNLTSTFNGGVRLLGLAGDDTLRAAGTGENTLDGGAGADRMLGGEGNDVFIVDNGADSVFGNLGIDEIRTSRTALLEVDDVENYTFTGSGVSFAAESGVASNRLTGTKFGDFLSSNFGNDSLIGGGGNDTLFGGAGVDLLDGGAGADSMAGGSDADEYIVDNANDIVNESSSGNSTVDTVFSSISFSLGAPTVTGDVEFLVLTGKGAISGTGNALDNNITGNAAANKLDGGAGADTLNGDAGNDTLTVDSLDVVTGGVGIDTVVALASVNLAATFDVENYILGKGAGAISITTGDAGGRITGNESANTISGGGANDTIDGGGGDDLIIGGAGSNKISAALGNDTVQAGFVGLAAHDLITGFDGNAAGGQDVVSLTALFDSLGVAVPDRASHVQIIDKGSTVEIHVDTSRVPGSDGSFDLFVATLQTKDTITVGTDVLV